jgi:DNA-binding LacI/PurR family transcriptional regulator
LKAFDRSRAYCLHETVREHLRQLIHDKFKDGERFWSELHVAQTLRISQGTARRALDDLAKEGLLIRRVPQGTFVCKTGAQVQTIGVFMRCHESLFNEDILEQISGVCREKQYRVKVYHLYRGETMGEVLWQIENQPKNERMVLLGNTPEVTLELYKHLSDRRYRSVNIDTLIKHYPGNYVGVDNELGVSIGLDHLTQLGHRNIAFLVSEPMEHENVIERVHAFRRMTKERGLKDAHVVLCDVELWDDAFQKSYDKIPAILGLKPRPTAIFAASDVGAWAAIKRLNESGIQVPSQISVLGFDNSRNSRYMTPAVSTIAQPLNEFARAAIELLDKEPGDRTVRKLAPSLLIRESTAPVAQ